MESYAQALNIGIPIFVLLILAEFLWGWRKNNVTLNMMDTVSSLSSGITNITKDVLGLGIAIVSYAWLEGKVGVYDIQPTLWVFALVFLAKDFAGYWIHRFEHEVNYFWNRHLIHHSSEEFNLACALRQSISEIFGFTTLILFPLAFLGVPPEVFAVVAPVHLFAQFWYHTRHIDKMGVLEKVIVTPSHHRVHHAINKEYLDKNFGQIFIFWDKWFGTFQPELEEVPPVYGVKRAVQTWNPILINFQHAWLVWRDFFMTKSWKDKARIWFMPTGWRPDDVKQKYPVESIQNVYSQQKYMPPASLGLQIWSGVQLLFVLFLALYLFNNLGEGVDKIGMGQALLYGGFIFLCIYAYTTLMDKKRHALWLETAKSALGLGILLYLGDWFRMGSFWQAGSYFVGGYFVLSAVVVAFFVLFEMRREPSSGNLAY